MTLTVPAFFNSYFTLLDTLLVSTGVVGTPEMSKACTAMKVHPYTVYKVETSCGGVCHCQSLI